MMQTEGSWKTETYHGAKLMVRAQLRQQENPALAGHGQEWDFCVRIDAMQAPDAADAGVVKSDPNVFYSTQVIAEQMGFIKARELVDHRNGANTNRPNQPTGTGAAP